MITLVVAQKNSVQKEIRKALPEYMVTSVAGHIKQLRYATLDKAPWLKTPLNRLLKDALTYHYDPKAIKSLSNLKSYSKEPSIRLILACDPDEQGHLIASHIVHYFNSNQLKQIYSVKLESLSPKGIKKAFKQMQPYTHNLSYSGELRARLDLLFGSILSRAISLDTFNKTQRWNTFNTGRVQSPTLNLVQTRAKKIKEFKPTSYYHYSIPDNSHIGPFNFPLKYDELSSQKSLKVSLLRSEPEYIQPRDGLNTDELLSLLSKEHSVFKKLSTSVTSLLSSMYLSGVITYPRTDNSSFGNYPELYDDLLLLYQREFECKAKSLKRPMTQVVTDHSPICPLKLSSEVEDPLQKKVLQTLYNHLRKVYSGPNEYIRHYFKTTLLDKEVKFSILQVVQKNFDDGLNSISKIGESKVFEVPLKVQIKETKAPLLYTPTTLLKDMVRHGVGTKSTRVKIIQDLLKHQYLQGAFKLQITRKGEYLCSYWLKRWPDIISTQLTKKIQSYFPINQYDQLMSYQLLYRSVLEGVVKVIFDELK